MVRFKIVISHLFPTSKNTWSLRAQFCHSSVKNSPTDFEGGCVVDEGKCCASHWGNQVPIEAAAELVSLQGADGG